MQPTVWLTSPTVTKSMAKIRVSTNPLYKGGAGGYSFYVRGGEQVVRQRKNNSNYGDTASRTFAQMVRRVKWSNLVNMYKVFKPWMPKAYEQKAPGQTDYNIFMSLNANIVNAALTRDMSLGDNCVIEPVQVSRGSLPVVDVSVVDGSLAYKTSIKCTLAVTANTTVGQLSSSIIANNAEFIDGDNLAIIKFINYLEPRVEWPVAQSVYAELTLDVSDTRTLASVVGLAGLFSKSEDNFLLLNANLENEVGVAAIHTRKSGASLAVSSQSIVMRTNAVVDQFIDEIWVMSCIMTYGLDPSVLLDPTISGATLTQVTANGLVIRSGTELSGTQVVRVYGYGLNDPSLRLLFNGEEYTPLAVADDYLEYLITANGRVVLMKGDSIVFAFTVADIVIPAGLPTRIWGALKDTDTASYQASHQINSMHRSPVVCLNYPYKPVEGHEYVIAVFESELTQADFTFVNCTMNNFSIDNGKTYINVSVTDAEEPAYIMYAGVVVFLFNYEQ